MGVAYLAAELIGGTAGRLVDAQVGGQLRIRHGPRRARRRRLGLQRKTRSVGSASVGCAGRERGGQQLLAFLVDLSVGCSAARFPNGHPLAVVRMWVLDPHRHLGRSSYSQV